MKVLSDINVYDKRVFVRADLDVSLKSTKDPSINSGQAGLTTNAEIATRLTNLKSTVDWLLEHGASRIIIAGHIDRPKRSDPEFSTKQILRPLKKILGQEITFSDVILGSEATPESDSGQARMTGESKVVLFENLRFWPGEEANDQDFAQELASTVDVYINEAFGNCHRNHASMVYLPSLFTDVKDPEGFHPRRAAGLHLEKEVEVLSKLLKNPARPYVVIVGGVKIETKLPVIKNLCKLADWVLVGGALPLEIKQEGLVFAKNVLVAGHAQGSKDITDKSQDDFAKVIKEAKTVVWNGPMGVFEEGFNKGTKEVAQAIIQSGAYSVVGGGETTQFLAQNNLLSKFSFVSSGGGAMLEFLAGKELPGIKALG